MKTLAEMTDRLAELTAQLVQLDEKQLKGAPQLFKYGHTHKRMIGGETGIRLCVSPSNKLVVMVGSLDQVETYTDPKDKVEKSRTTWSFAQGVKVFNGDQTELALTFYDELVAAWEELDAAATWGWSETGVDAVALAEAGDFW